MAHKHPWLSSSVRCPVLQRERFPSENVAIQAIISRGWIARTYECKFCGGWHITRRPWMDKTQDTPLHALLRKAMTEQRTTYAGSITGRRKLHRYVLDGKTYTFEYNKRSGTIRVRSIEEAGHETDSLLLP